MEDSDGEGGMVKNVEERTWKQCVISIECSMVTKR